MDAVTPQPLSAVLLDWYDRHRRTLAWRAPPGETPDPYRVWLSEIMLQQTTVAAVDGYFRRFVELWPTVADLANAELDDVLRQWAGLGYYARARNLHKCARMLVDNFGGRFPDTEDDLLELPGIGPYTAAAIASIAFDRPAAAVDGNVERVISRLHAIETPLPDSKPDIRQRALALVPEARAGDFAQAMMDLGATVCAPKKANCLLCPWQEPCEARRLGIADTLPRRKPKAERPTRYGVAFWLEDGEGRVLLRRRPEKGLLGGMMEIPSTEWGGEWPDDPARAAPARADWRMTVNRVEHTFTHFHLVLKIMSASSRGKLDDQCWVRKSQLDGEALPSVMRKIVAAMTN